MNLLPAQVHHWHVVIAAVRGKSAGQKAHLHMGDEIVAVDDVYVQQGNIAGFSDRLSFHSLFYNTIRTRLHSHVVANFNDMVTFRYIVAQELHFKIQSKRAYNSI
jgi:predicted metalloprotease with PDZ domain